MDQVLSKPDQLFEVKKVKKMAKEKKTKPIKIYIGLIGNTLNMWWGNPKDSVLSEEAEKTWDVICLDKKGRPIGLEKIGFFSGIRSC